MGKPRSVCKVGRRLLQVHGEKDGADAEQWQPLVDRGAIRSRCSEHRHQVAYPAKVVVLHGFLVSITCGARLISA